MSFWLRYGVIGVVLTVIAYVLLANQEWVDLLVGDGKSNDESSVTVVTNKDSLTENATMADKKTVTPEKPVVSKVKNKSKNAAAEGLSNFYASINPDLGKSGPIIRNNVVFLPAPEGDITEILEDKDRITQPQKRNWKGSIESRPFRSGETLFQKLSEYSEREGVEVLWWLDRDFIIKDAFRINKDLINTAQIISLSVEGHFVDGINAYFCYSNKTFVLTDTENTYLESNCNKLNN